MKHSVRTILAALAILPLAACGNSIGASGGEDSVSLDLSHSLPDEHPQAEAMTKFAELVAEESGGSVEINVFPAGQLYNEVELIDALPSGATDLGLINVAQWSGTVPTSQIMDVPFLFESTEDVHEAFDDDFGDALADNFANSNVHIASWIDYEFLQLASNPVIQTPKDMPGKTVRTASALVAQAIQAANGSSVTMSGSEAYTALQRGVADGALSGYTSFVDRAYYEVTDKVLELDIVFNMFAIGMNTGVWESLTPEQQKAMTAAEAELIPWQREQQATAVEESKSAVQEHGMTVYEPTDGEMQDWQDAMKPVKQDFTKATGDDGEELLDMLGQ